MFRSMMTAVRALVVAAAACGLALFAATPAGAAPIIWGPATNIAGDSDVDTSGTLVAALNLGGANTTINGVVFQGVGSGISTGSALPPFANLSAAYKAMLGTAVTGSPITVTFNSLTVGANYRLQLWVNDSRDHNPPGFTFKTDITSGGNSVSLDPNTSIVEGGIGQHVIGTFIADSTTQSIIFDNSEVGGLLNGLQLRLVDNANGPANVPLPAAAWMGVALAAVVVARRRG